IMDCLKHPATCDVRSLGDNFLKITGEGGYISTDLRLFRPVFRTMRDTAPGLKLPAVADAVAEAYRTRPNPGAMRPGSDDSLDGIGGRGTPLRPRTNPPAPAIWNQLVFCNYVRTKDGRSFHALIKQALIERGIPAAEICIINGQVVGVDPKTGEDHVVRTGEDKEELKAEAQDDFNNGR